MKYRYILLLLVITHLIMAPWCYIGGEGPARILASYYLADYNVAVHLTDLDTRGEIFIQFVMSIIIRICDLFRLPISFSADIILYSFPLLNLTSIFFAYLLGSSLFGRKIGLYFSLLLGLSYQFWYFGNQTRIEPVCATLMLASVYFFWKCVQNGAEWYWFVLWGLFTVFAFEATYFAALLPIFYLLFLVLSRKISWIRQRNTWLAISVGVLALIPWFYFNHFHTGSLLGPLATLSSEAFLIRAYAIQLYGYLVYFAYVQRIPFCLPFPNFVFFIYGIYFSLKNYIKKKHEAHLFALLYISVVLGGMSIIITYFFEWYLPILMPSLALFTGIGLYGIFTWINSSRKFRKYSSALCVSIFLLSALTINQIHPFFAIYFEGASIHFYSIDKILNGFAYPKIIEWSNLYVLAAIIKTIGTVNKTTRPIVFSAMLLLYYSLLTFAAILGAYIVLMKTSIFPSIRRKRRT